MNDETLSLHPSVKNVLADIKARFPNSPFLALGQTALWDEPTKASLRLALPDLLKGVDAYRRGDRDFFLIPDEDAQSLGAKLITQLVWYGYSRTFFVPDFVEEIALKAGFREVRHVGFKQTTTEHAEITELDNREAESLFVEAVK